MVRDYQIQIHRLVLKYREVKEGLLYLQLLENKRLTLKDNKVNYQTITSCLTPLGNIIGKHVVTVEGINGDDLTPVQNLLAARR